MTTFDELRRLSVWLDGTGAKVNLVLFATLLGVGLPWAFGLPYLDPLVIVGVSLSSVVFVAAVVGQAGGDVNRQTLFPRLVALTVGGAVYGIAVVVAGVATVNVLNWHGDLLAPATLTCVTAPVLSGSLSAFFATEGFHLARIGYKAREIGARFRWGTLILVMAFYFRHSWMPTAATEWLARRSTTPGIAWGVLLISLLLLVWTLRRYRSLPSFRQG